MPFILLVRYNLDMRMRKRKWIDSYIDSDDVYIIKDAKGLKDIFLEVGMGMGDFIIESACLHPENLYIGLEKNSTCVARTIKKANDNSLNNIRIIYRNASSILDLFNPGSIKMIYLHFSDPWPKKAHHKRRLTYPTFLKMYEELLMDDGLLVFKTDNVQLFDDSLEYFNETNFVIDEISRDYHSIKRDEPKTGYESKFVQEGKPIYYVRLRKAYK